MPTLHLITREESPLAERSPEPYAALTEALNTLPEVTLVDHPTAAEALILIEPFSFKEWRYIKALESCSVLSKHGHRTYTVNFDDAATGLLRGAYVGLRKSRFDARIHRAIPYPQSPNQLITQEHPQSETTLLATYRGNPKSNKIRHRLLKAYKNHPRIQVESTESWMNHGRHEQQHYVNLLRKGKFALCPAGWAPVSFRIYEAMALERCPVVIADEFMQPEYLNWDAFSLRIPESGIHKIATILEQEESRALELGKHARIEWERHCSPTSAWTHIARSLVDCIHAAPKISMAQERARWNSPILAWRNGWTPPQRLVHKVRRMLSKRH